MRVRINNIECRFSQGRYEIVKWYPNDYYGAEEKMISEGWEKVTSERGWSLRKGQTSVMDGCFRNPESCYTIATLKWDSHEDWCVMTTVGNRLLGLDEDDRQDFFDVYNLSEGKILKENEKDEDI